MKDKEHDFSKDSEAVVPGLTRKDCGNTRTLLSENRFTESTGSERNGSSRMIRFRLELPLTLATTPNRYRT